MTVTITGLGLIKKILPAPRSFELSDSADHVLKQTVESLLQLTRDTHFIYNVNGKIIKGDSILKDGDIICLMKPLCAG